MAKPTHANPVLIVNPRAGRGGAEELLAAAAERGIQTHVLGEEDDVASLARTAEADALGMAGGDGSMAQLAQVAVERDLPFACIPFGTRNHFARDLGLDRDDPLAALDAFTDGVERRVDVGYANDRLFLNNVSLGAYAHLVHRRERHRRRRDAFARLRALGTLVTHRHDDGLTLDGAPLDARIVLVSNNAYDLTLLSVGERERLDEGRLYLYAPTGVLRPQWEGRSGERFTIAAQERHVRSAIDGEPEILDLPIEFTIARGALRVLVPRGPGG
jgi:diacylglycerol kinase family enzyme